MAEPLNVEQLADSIFGSIKTYVTAAVNKRVALLEDVQRSLLQRVDRLSAENAELRARLDAVEQKDARPELRAVR